MVKMRTLYVQTKEHNYPIEISWENIYKITDLLPDKAKVLIITDENIYKLYNGKLKNLLENSQTKKEIKHRLKILPPGEETKNLEMVKELYDEACDFEMDRDSFFIALGGGVIGDLTGFVASTYMRGTKLLQVPTTLLAQVDSSVGGKVAVNHPMQKNLIGSFYHPGAVLIHLNFLFTLPEREFNAGLAEVVKSAILWDREYFFFLKDFVKRQFPLANNWVQENDQVKEDLAKIVHRACEIKAQIVKIDEKDHGLRQILNLGHTYAHALEAVTGYSYFKHGEAVMWGILFASQLSYRKKIISLGDKEEISSLIKKLDPPSLPNNLKTEHLQKYFVTDKKRRGDIIPFILPEAIGRADIYKEITMDEAVCVIDEYEY